MRRLLIWSTVVVVLALSASAAPTVELPPSISRRDIKHCQDNLDLASLRFEERAPDGSWQELRIQKESVPGWSPQLAEQVDLDGDGVCELFLIGPGGGTGGTDYLLFHKNGDRYRSIGSVFGFGLQFRERKNGFYQISAGTKAGAGRYGTLLHAYGVDRYEVVLSANANEIRILRREGEEAYQRGRLQEAVVLLEKAVNSEPDDYIAKSDLGLVYFRLKRFADAMRVLREVTDSPETKYPLWGADDRTRASAHFNLGLVHEAQGRTSTALEHYRRAYAYFPSPAREQTLNRLVPGAPLPETEESIRRRLSPPKPVEVKPYAAVIHSARVISADGRQAVVEVTVGYSGARHPWPGTVDVIPAKSGNKRGLWWSRPQVIMPGTSTTQIRTGLIRPLDEKFCTDGFYVRVVGGQRWLAGQYIARPACWK